MKRTKWTVRDLELELSRQGLSYCQAALYKALRSLISSGVIVRKKGQHELSISWLLQLSQFADHCLKNSETPLIDAIPNLQRSSAVKWSFGSLFSLNDAYSHCIISLIRSTKAKTVYSWNPHPWFHLIQPENEQRYISSLELLQVKMQKLIGGKTPLDHQISTLWNPEHIEARFADTDWNFKSHEYFFIIPPFVLSMKIPKRTADSIDLFFNHTRSIRQINLIEMRKVFIETNNRYQLTVELRNQKASDLSSRIRRYFE